MRKKFTRALAIACALAMLAPATAPAYAEETQQTSSEFSGDSTIETDNSTLPKLQRVVLPTISEDTYNFTIDVEGLLNQFDSANYDAASNVYFYSLKTAASFALPTVASHTFSFVKYDKAKLANGATDVLGKVTGKTVSAFDTLKLYVWQPDENKITTTGEGKYVEIDSTNYDTFFDVTLDADNKITGLTFDTTPQTGTVAEIWSGDVYEEAYTTADPAEYFDADTKTFSDGIFVEDDDSSTKVYTKPVVGTAGTGETAITYTAPVYQYINKSDKATIINKSTFNIGVTADVTVTAPGLTFVANNALATASTAADIYLRIGDAANLATNGVDVSAGAAKAYFVIPGTGGDAIMYQTAGTEGSNTGGHNYYKYLKPTSTYQSASFQIQAGADTDYTTDNGSKAAWDAYVASVEAGTVAKPEIDIVYRFVEVDEGTVTTGTKVVYKAANKAEFTYTDSGVGSAAPTTATWVTYDATNVQKHTISVTGSNGSADKTTNVEAGEVVTITPNVTTTGKMVGTVTVAYTKTDSSSGSITATKQANGKYTFTVPSDVKSDALTLTVTINEVEQAGFELDSYEYIAGTATTVTMFPTTGTIDSVAYTKGGVETALTKGTEYTVSSNVITLSADTGVLATLSTNRGASGKADYESSLVVVVSGTKYTVPFTVKSKTN